MMGIVGYFLRPGRSYGNVSARTTNHPVPNATVSPRVLSNARPLNVSGVFFIEVAL